MRPLFSCLSTASRYFPQFELVYGVKTFPPADEAAVSCAPNLKLHVDPVPRCVTGQSLPGQGGHCVLVSIFIH